MKALLVALLAAAAAGAVARPATTSAPGWWCEAPAYCQPATGPGLVSASKPNTAISPISGQDADAAAALPAGASPLWGQAGELWDPAGRLMDWSFAGYKQGNEPIPTPPVTKSYKEFQLPGMSDTDAFKAALDWAHKQPIWEWIVLRIPAGVHTLNRQLIIRRPRLVLRGDGSKSTVLKIDTPLERIPGVPKMGGGYGYFNQEAFVNFRGDYLVDAKPLTSVFGTANRGGKLIVVADPSKLQVGQYIVVVLSDNRAGSLTRDLMNNRPLNMGSTTPGRYMLVRFAVKIEKIYKNWVLLERPLPFNIRPEFSPLVFNRVGTVFDSGIEGVHFLFKWEKARPHHYEAGYNAIEFKEVFDCWARDVQITNPDDGIFIDKSTGVQINDLSILQTQPRGGGKGPDGHWGVHSGSSGDVLVDRFYIAPSMLHCVGADAMSMFAVFSNGVMKNGNLELHRGGAAQALFTNINTGVAERSFYSGGPDHSGPNTLAWTTFWNVVSASGAPMKPPASNTAKSGNCSFGPDLTFVGVKLTGQFCSSWYYSPASVQPANLYKAQLTRRLASRP